MLTEDAPIEISDQLRVYYQPQVDITTGIVVGAEALVRWHNPRLGVLAPGEFLDLVEENGLIGELTSRVLYESTAQLVEWRIAGLAMRMSVNLSPDVLAGPELPQLLDAVLRVTPLEPADLALEITESSFMTDPQQVLATTREIARRGVGVSIDDFGTGYSSLDTLHRFPVDAFKIDRSFVAGLTTSDRTEELVRAIIAMGKALGLDVVAEGVETTEQLQFLQDIGCATGQGFLFMPAVPGDRALELIGRVLVSEQPARLTLTQPPSTPDPDRRLRAG
jgi:EAL domain-containing protein (putative c-di-GMP-specific phosphodiesterase class I)